MKKNSPKTFPAISRRILLQLMGAGLLTGFSAGFSGCAPVFVPDTGNRKEAGLSRFLKQNGRRYGAAVQARQLRDPAFAALLRKEAALLVPERELKWSALRPSRNKFDFSAHEPIAAFARANGMEVRGHALVWHNANPKWLLRALKKKQGAEKIMEEHIRRVVAETSPLIRDWDVVNEAVQAASPRADGLRPSPWLDALGPEYAALAFRLAHDAGPELTLTYNDNSLEYGGGDGRVKRDYALRLLTQLKKDGVPVHQLGLQSHLQAHRPLGSDAFRDFLKEVRDLGLDIAVTELDLDVSRLTGRMDDRVKLGQNYLDVYLGMIQESGPVKTLVTWGLSDRYSWMRGARPAGLRGMLPYDASLTRQEMWESLARAWLG